MNRLYYCLLLPLLFAALAGCSNESHSDFPESGSQIIVDYALGTEAIGTRAGADDRINSLHYLAYDIEKDSLVKFIEIPGIDKVTEWPLLRSNMTWEQRQALQDTLKLHTNYRVIFVANASPALFGNGEGELLRNLEKYSTAYLALPSADFNDSNLYYFWSREIAAETTLHEEPYLCNVVLQRIMTRSKVSCINIPDKVATPSEYETFVRNAIENSLYKSLEEDIQKQVNATIESFLTATGLAAGAGTIPLVYAKDIDDMRKAMNENKREIALTLKEQIITTFYNDIISTATFKSKCRDWNLGGEGQVEVHYKAGKRVNGFPLNLGRAKNVTPENPVLKRGAMSDGSFTFYAFSAGESEVEQREMNIIEKLSFFAPSAPDTPLLEEVGEWNSMQGKNSSKRIICNPIGNISFIDKSTKSFDFYTDLNPFFPPQWSIPTFENTMIDVIISPFGNHAYGDSFSRFKFVLNLPVINEADGTFKIEPNFDIIPE